MVEVILTEPKQIKLLNAKLCQERHRTFWDADDLPLVSREWKNGSNSSHNCTPFLHFLLTKAKMKDEKSQQTNQVTGLAEKMTSLDSSSSSTGHFNNRWVVVKIRVPFGVPIYSTAPII